jgi:hypothetical protein
MSARSVYTRQIASEDDRGPDSVECQSANFGLGAFTHHDCFMDYGDLGAGFGFVCGCSCHDEEAPDA